MKSVRPVHLNLLQIRFPIMAIVSILHRITGVLIFLALPILLFFLNHSLASATSYSNTVVLCQGVFCKLFFWLVLVALIYHLLAGVRHIIMDFGVGESLAAARFTAYFMLLATAILSFLLGVWIW